MDAYNAVEAAVQKPNPRKELPSFKWIDATLFLHEEG
jgi:hypothetical protein